jgi:hypothetical protein
MICVRKVTVSRFVCAGAHESEKKAQKEVIRSPNVIIQEAVLETVFRRGVER